MKLRKADEMGNTTMINPPKMLIRFSLSHY